MKALCALLVLLCASSALAMSEEEFAAVYYKAAKLWPARGASSRFVKREGEAAISRADSYKPGLPDGFKCPPLAPSVTTPTNARFVRPSDIKVVGAMGDSLTAGNGVNAWTVPTVLKQYRGLSWSAGGDDDITKVLTMPNILKKYNPKLYGFSVGSSYSQDTKDAYYNVAKAGNTAVELADQSKVIVQKMTTDKRQSDWKIITLFIGGNDICEYCNNRVLYSVENYKNNIVAAIDYLYASLPNTIINLVAPLDMTQVSSLPTGFSCRAVHKGVCGCLYNTSDPDYATRMSHLYQKQILDIVAEGPKRWQRENFAVAYHPQFSDGKLPMVNGAPDTSYFAPDCFHFSQKGQETAAYNLWNNMMRPVEKRITALIYDNRVLECPTEESPFIQV